jgi:aminoglycoside phosphotransferase (APT) family kinase protein
VEPEFYARAASPLLPGHRSLGRLDGCATMTLDWIDAPRLDTVAQGPDELVARGREVVAGIGAIRGDLPVYLDVGGADAWSAVAETVLAKLARLVARGRFRRVDAGAVARLRAWSATPAVRETIGVAPRVAHGDLTAGQVFVTPDGYRVVDWQRPVLGPPDIDLVALLVDRRHDPRPYLPAPVVGVFWFLFLHWAVVAQHDLFPERRWPLFDGWAAASVTRILR